MDYTKLSSYQNPEGVLTDRLAPRTDKRLSMMSMYDLCHDRSVLDIGCNNGYFVREAIKNQARRVVGVDKSDCIIGARELARQENVKAEFWQLDVESKEFKRFCPQFEVIFLMSVITHLKDMESFLDWLDDRIVYTLVFESNHGEKNKRHIDLVTKYIHFDTVDYLGPSDIPEKPHYLWICRKFKHDIRYPQLAYLPVEFVPIDKIVGWDEESILKQDTTYPLDSDKFKALKEDIRIRGLRRSVVVHDEKDGYFRGFQGGHRYLALKQLGYKEVPCRVARGLYFKHLKR